jgi:FKBP-type peptidyl-prolyl cis-trans isomerase FklB
MKKFFLFAIPVILVIMNGLVGCSCSSKLDLKTDVDTLSYYFGMSRADGIINYLMFQAGVDTAYMDDFYKGFRDGIDSYSPKDVAYLEGKKIAQLINNQWIEGLNKDLFLNDSTQSVNRKAVLIGFYHGVKNPNDMTIMQANTISQSKIAEVKESVLSKKYAETKERNDKFLTDNKNKEGVKTTDSGLQYKIITDGSGETPKLQSKVKVNYRGTLIDGTEFDSSYKNNAPASFYVSQLIKGWSEALMLMPVGSKWELYIPQNLAYGSNEQANIPPFSTLIFEVELVEIEK